jgi:hypothetical protein
MRASVSATVTVAHSPAPVAAASVSGVPGYSVDAGGGYAGQALPPSRPPAAPPDPLDPEEPDAPAEEPDDPPDPGEPVDPPDPEAPDEPPPAPESGDSPPSEIPPSRVSAVRDRTSVDEQAAKVSETTTRAVSFFMRRPA